MKVNIEKIRAFFNKNLGENKYNIYVYAAIVAILLNYALIIVYISKILSYYASESVNESPLNIEAIDYVAAYSLTYENGRHTFSFTYLFVIFLGIAFLLLLYFYVKVTEKPSIIRFILIVLFITIIIQMSVTILLGISIKNVKNRIDTMNTFIRNKIYKKGDFLDNLNGHTDSTVETNRRIMTCIDKLKHVKDKNELAKGFYTLTLYYYYQEFPSKNKAIHGAYQLFNLTSLLGGKSQPSSYMPRYGTFIESISETLIRPNIPVKAHYLNEAMYLCDKWITETNEYANTIYPSEAYNSFMLLIIVTIVINILMVTIITNYASITHKLTSNN